MSSYQFHPAIGPIKRSKLSLMGLRFAEGAGEGAPAAPAAESAPEAGAAESPQAPTDASAAQSVQELPEWAQKIVSDARAGEARYRTEAKTAAENAVKALTDKLAGALGVKEEAAADPDALAKSLTQAQAEAAQRARELAIFKAATQAGADPNRLLDSNSFMSSVNGLDPADGAAVLAAINAATAANPTLKAVQAAAASGTELGGSQEAGLITDEQLARMSPEQIDKALREGKLKHLLA